MPIGNLTSQIFANIYLNEFDRFVKHNLKSKAYLRYGDDFIIVEPDLQKLKFFRLQTVDFLRKKLALTINAKSDKIVKAKYGLKFLGVILWPRGRRLNRRNVKRIAMRLNSGNVASYRGLTLQHVFSPKGKKFFHWLIYEKCLLL